MCYFWCFSGPPEIPQKTTAGREPSAGVDQSNTYVNTFYPSTLPSRTPSPGSRKVAPGVFLPAPYPDDLVTRSRIAHLRFPAATLGGWSAAAYLGLTLEKDTAPVTVMHRSLRRRNQSDLLFIDTNPVQKFRPDPAFPQLRICGPTESAIQCLQILQKGRHSWWVPRIAGLSDTQIRQVQILDQLRRQVNVDPAMLLLDAKDRFDTHRLQNLISLSDGNAGSPRETLLRLILHDIPGLESQVKIYDPSGAFITQADLAIPELMVAIFYDGEDHLERAQRDYDSKVWALSDQMGWRTFRITSGMLSDPAWIRAHVEQLVAEARAEQLTRKSFMIRQTKAGRPWDRPA